MDLLIQSLEGNSPVEGWGTVNGVAFYFHARGETWRLGIGGADPETGPEWQHHEWFGEWPDAGWITGTQAATFIRRAAELWVEGMPGGKLSDDPARCEAARAWFRRTLDC